MSFNDTPRANRLHIGIYGKRNSGKSSLINALTGQDIALVSSEAGTTTDPVFKSMELHPVGPVVFIDTAGFDDEGELGRMRVERTQAVTDKTDVAVMVIDGASLNSDASDETSGEFAGGEYADSSSEKFAHEKKWIEELEKKDVPVIIAVNKFDEFHAKAHAQMQAGVATGEAGLADGKQPENCNSGCNAADEFLALVVAEFGKYPVIAVSAGAGIGLNRLRTAIADAVPEDFLREKILGDMIGDGELAMLVMPQDIQAPKGRLILPQVQTLRELLDRKCTAIATTADGFEKALATLNRAPDLIITDSQCFAQVYEKKPAESALTSFSVLFAAYKGDIDKFVAGASQLDDMTENSRVLIAEACTHVPLSEDIGRVKIPNLLRKKFGKGIEVVNVNGNDFPGIEELKKFDLVIHCGACMFNRKHVLSRIAAAQAAGVPITNYGVVLAKLTGIIDKIKIPQGGK